jgi:PBP1b-binding outer membrane lipoprotein LpoB
MKRVKTASLITLTVAVLLSALLVSGCSGKTWKKTTVPDMSPFSEQTVAMAGDIYFSFSNVRAVSLRSNIKGPEIDKLRQMGERARIYMTNIISYSLQVTTLSQSSKKGPEMAQALADFVNELIYPEEKVERVHVKMGDEEVKKIIQNIREQENLLAALRAAQPLIDESSRAAQGFMDEFKAAYEDTTAAVLRSVDEEHGTVLTQDKILRDLERQVLGIYQTLFAYLQGNKALLEELKSMKTQTAAFDNVTIDDGITIQEAWKVEDVLLQRMQRIAVQRQALAPEIALYQTKRAELSKLTDNIDQTIIKARAAIITWNRVHQQMSKGITKPADINLFGITKQIINSAKALPFI